METGPMKQPIRLLVSDVDGTLVRHDKTLAEATIVAAHRVLHAQLQMTLISARPPSGILPLARALGLTSPLAAFNGGTLMTPDGTILAAHHLSAEASRATVDIVAASGASLWLFADGQWFASDADNPHIPREKLSAMVDPVFGADIAALHGRIDKIVGVSDDTSADGRAGGRYPHRARRVGRSLAVAALLLRHHPSARQQGRRHRRAGAQRSTCRWRRRRRSATCPTTSRCSAAPAWRSRWGRRRTR